jgi:hypothetical protein
MDKIHVKNQPVILNRFEKIKAVFVFCLSQLKQSCSTPNHVIFLSSTDNATI